MQVSEQQQAPRASQARKRHAEATRDPASRRADLSKLGPAARVLGALSVLAVGAVHLQQYDYLYSAIPTIGTLFLLNFAGASAIGLGLLAPLERLLGRLGATAHALLALGGIGLAATAFVFLLIAERTPVFGFQEPGYDPTAIMASRVSEIVTVIALGGYLALRLFRTEAAERR
jgi:hypothetical protein